MMTLGATFRDLLQKSKRAGVTEIKHPNGPQDPSIVTVTTCQARVDGLPVTVRVADFRGDYTVIVKRPGFLRAAFVSRRGNDLILHGTGERVAAMTETIRQIVSSL